MTRAKKNLRQSNGNLYRKNQRRLRAEGNPCALCGYPIDYSLTTYYDQQKGKYLPHPMRFEVDHIVPVSRGGDPYDYANLQAAHRICNQKKSNHMDGDTQYRPIKRSKTF